MNSRVGNNSDYVEGVDNLKPRNVIDHYENYQGDKFINFLCDTNFAMLNGRFNDNEFTYISPTGRSVVDYICVPYENMEIVNSFSVLAMSKVINEIGFVPDKIPDHSLLLCDLIIDCKQNVQINTNTNLNTGNTKYKVSNVPNNFLNSDEMATKIHETIHNIEQSLRINENVQEAYDEFQTLIHGEMADKLPTMTFINGAQKRKKSLYKPYWNHELTELWNKVCEAESKWLKYQGSNNVKKQYKIVFCEARKLFDRTNRKYKRKYVKQEQYKLEEKMKSFDKGEFWKTIGKTGIVNDRKPNIPWAVVDEYGHVKRDKDSVLQKWRDDFHKLFTSDAHNTTLNETEFNAETDVASLNEPITREEVYLAVEHSKRRKAAGIDNIPAEVIKNNTAIDLLHKIINGCFALGQVPTEWTSGIINPILKPGAVDDRCPLNYRGITLISVPCKIYCSVLNNRLSKWLEENDCLCDEQNGFRSGRGCEEHIFTLYSILNDRKISRKSTYVCFVDMKKAFDTVRRDLLWYKLQVMGIRGQFLNAVKSLYENVQCTVRVNSLLSPWFDVSAGVKQGCILSPTLFSVYINDLADRINSLQCGVSYSEEMLSILLYADDIALIAPDEQSLQNMLCVLTDWCSSWKLSVNPDKTKVVHFRPQSCDKTDFNFRCSNFDITTTDSYKYLGIWIDEHLTFSKNTKELAKSASRALGAVFGKFISSGGMSYNVYTKMYNSMVEPVLMYGSGIWGTKSYSVINAVQNKAAKYFLSVGKNTSNIAVTGDIGWTSCLNKQRISCVRLLCKLKRTDEDRTIYKLWRWISRRRKGWNFEVDKIVSLLDKTFDVNNITVSTKTVMKNILDKVNNLNNIEWQTQLYDDRGNVNGNKLRTYREYKENCQVEPYVKQIIPRSYRRIMALFRAGSLPLAIETGRYARPHIPLNNRLCIYAMTIAWKLKNISC